MILSLILAVAIKPIARPGPGSAAATQALSSNNPPSRPIFTLTPTKPAATPIALPTTTPPAPVSPTSSRSSVTVTAPSPTTVPSERINPWPQRQSQKRRALPTKQSSDLFLTFELLPTATPSAAHRSLLVDQDSQMMHVYERGAEVRRIPVSSGAPISNRFTPAWQGAVGSDWGGGSIGREGFYTDQMWYLFAGAEGSILIHSLPYKISELDEKIYDQPQALGVRPTSHGCVRISPEDAAWLKNWNPVDVPIRITRWSGDITPAGDSAAEYSELNIR